MPSSWGACLPGVNAPQRGGATRIAKLPLSIVAVDAGPQNGGLDRLHFRGWSISCPRAPGLPGVQSVQVNLVHGIILVHADPDRISEREVARKLEDLGYAVVATEAQQLRTGEALFATIKRRGVLAMGLAVADLLFDPLDRFGVVPGVRAVVSGIVAPALVQSDVGIALGAGTDVAMESAGVVLVSDRLDRVVAAIRRGPASHRKMQQNIRAVGEETARAEAVETTVPLREPGHKLCPPEVVETVIPARRIHCRSCTAQIEAQFSQMPGVRKVAADAGRKEVLLAFEPSRVSEDTLRGRLEEMGYR